MKVSSVLLTAVFAQETQESSGEQQPEVDIQSKSTDEGILLEGESTGKLPSFLELVEPLYQVRFEASPSIDILEGVSSRNRLRQQSPSAMPWSRRKLRAKRPDQQPVRLSLCHRVSGKPRKRSCRRLQW